MCRVEISLKPGVLDAEGNAAADGLRALGFKVEKVCFTKEYVIEGNFSAEDAEEMCSKFFSNPIIQDYKIEEIKEKAGATKPKAAKSKATSKASKKPAKKQGKKSGKKRK